MESIFIAFLKNNLLSISVFFVTVTLIVYLLKDKNSSRKLSKRYRESIYEAQTRIYLNATKHLLSGDREQAIQEFLAAVEVSKEALDAYFALGELFRSNGEIDKAITVHQSIIARENLEEQVRIKALKELALDYDQGGFVDKAVDSYKDLLKINKEDEDVVTALCLIFEATEDWDEAIKYRTLLSKINNKSQDTIISHIVVQKGLASLRHGDKAKSIECLDQALSYAPSLSVKLFRVILTIVDRDIDLAKSLLNEFVLEHPNKSRMVLTVFNAISDLENKYEGLDLVLKEVKNYFLTTFKDKNIEDTDYKFFKLSIIEDGDNSLSEKIFVLESIFNSQVENRVKNAVTIELSRLYLIDGDHEKALAVLDGYQKTSTENLFQNQCGNCGYESNHFFWRCPQCHSWESINFKEVVL